MRIKTTKFARICLILLIYFLGWHSFGQQIFLYKKVDTTKLFVEVYYPPSLDTLTEKKLPAMIFFFGGGWVNGDRTRLKYHAEYFSKRGIVCFLADYRTKSRNNTTPFQALKDAKSAVRFVRKNAAKFNIDPEKIIASGGSAGGQLAAATALIDDYNQYSDDLSISCKPDALVLYCPVIDNGPGGYGYERIGEEYKKFSPIHNIKTGAPPTLILNGTIDKHIPVETLEYYKTVMEKVGSRCEIELYKNQQHGFFNHWNFEYYKATLKRSDEFLQSLGYLKKEPEVSIN